MGRYWYTVKVKPPKVLVALLSLAVLLAVVPLFMQVGAQQQQQQRVVTPRTTSGTLHSTSHGHDEYVTEVRLLTSLIGFVVANSLVVITAAVVLGRKLEKIDNHSREIAQITAEVARVSAGQTKILEELSEVRGYMNAVREGK